MKECIVSSHSSVSQMREVLTGTARIESVYVRELIIVMQLQYSNRQLENPGSIYTRQGNRSSGSRAIKLMGHGPDHRSRSKLVGATHPGTLMNRVPLRCDGMWYAEFPPITKVKW